MRFLFHLSIALSFIIDILLSRLLFLFEYNIEIRVHCSIFNKYFLFTFYQISITQTVSGHKYLTKYLFFSLSPSFYQVFSNNSISFIIVQFHIPLFKIYNSQSVFFLKGRFNGNVSYHYFIILLSQKIKYKRKKKKTKQKEERNDWNVRREPRSILPSPLYFPDLPLLSSSFFFCFVDCAKSLSSLQFVEFPDLHAKIMRLFTLISPHFLLSISIVVIIVIIILIIAYDNDGAPRY